MLLISQFVWWIYIRFKMMFTFIVLFFYLPKYQACQLTHFLPRNSSMFSPYHVKFYKMRGLGSISFVIVLFHITFSSLFQGYWSPGRHRKCSELSKIMWTSTQQLELSLFLDSLIFLTSFYLSSHTTHHSFKLIILIVKHLVLSINFSLRDTNFFHRRDIWSPLLFIFQ
jgi:hypothetical protein